MRDGYPGRTMRWFVLGMSMSLDDFIERGGGELDEHRSHVHATVRL